ncbi:hypothetical protein B0H65DRAFT_583524, partial [Neurospora tetraspora]
LNTRQTTTGRCGANYGRCPDNLCCSDYSYCGDSVDHCYPGFDCQPAYGVCGWPRPVATTTSTTIRPTSSTSTTSSTRSSSTTSTTSTTSSSTRSSTSTSTSSSVPIPTDPTGIITTNGQCGNSTICPGIADAGWGPCCSQFFWCGSGPEYCGAGCQSAFGLCDVDSGPPGTTTTPPTSTSTSSTTSTTTTSRITTTSTTSTSRTTSTSTRTGTTTSTSAGPTITLPPGQVSSRDGRCGNGQNCLGSTYGRCCSQFGWCGEGDQFCPYIVGCQTEFGYCDPPTF